MYIARALRARSLHSSAALRARILAADPIDPICGQIFVRATGLRAPARLLHARIVLTAHLALLFPPQRERGHEVVEASKSTFPVAELMETIGNYEGLVVRLLLFARTAWYSGAHGHS